MSWENGMAGRLTKGKSGTDTNKNRKVRYKNGGTSSKAILIKIKLVPHNKATKTAQIIYFLLNLNTDCILNTLII